ncbi:MAG: hypothetical protein PVJ06_08490 [Desulfobacterales bacterium]
MGIGSLTARVRFLKIGLCRVIRNPDVIIRAGTRWLVVYGKLIDGGICKGPRLRLHIPQVKMFEDLFDYIRVLDENNDPHSTRTL